MADEERLPTTAELAAQSWLLRVEVDEKDLQEGLSAQIAEKLSQLRGATQELLTPYDVEVVNPITAQLWQNAGLPGQPPPEKRTVYPRVQITVRMPEKGTVQVVVQRVKPMEKPKVLQEFSGDHFTALDARITALKMSWEYYMEQVTHG